MLVPENFSAENKIPKVGPWQDRGARRRRPESLHSPEQTGLAAWARAHDQQVLSCTYVLGTML
jgi:hypothetical protein